MFRHLSEWRVRTSPRRRRTWAGAVTASAVGLPLALGSLLGEGEPFVEVAPASGGAWLASPAEGLVSLLDGPSRQIAASVRVRAGDLTVEQAGTSAYVASSDDGTVTRVDGAHYEPSDPVRLGTAGGGTRVLQGGGAVYVVDVAARTAMLVDPTSLEVLEEVSMRARPGPGQAVVDEAGRLWVVDSAGGGLTWFDGSHHVDPGAADADDQVVLVRGAPVLVDGDGGLAPIAPSGDVGQASCLEARVEDAVQVLGSRERDEVFAALGATGTLLVGAVGRDDCGRVIRIADPTGAVDFGPLAQSGRFVFVPNRATGETVVVDTDTDTEVGRFDLAAPGNRLELVGEDGMVFYNDLDGSTAGVLTFDGASWQQGEAVAKYDPATGAAEAVVTPDDGTASLPPPVPGGGSANTGDPAPPGGTEPPAPIDAPTAPPTVPAPSAQTSSPPAADAPRRPGDRRTAPGTGVGEDEEPATLAPTVSAVTAAPAVIGVDGTTVVTATVGRGLGATWELRVAAPACGFSWSTGTAPLTAPTLQAEAFSHPVGPLPTTCLGAHTVELLVTGPHGSASGSGVLDVVADPARTPAIADLRCVPEHPATTDALECSAREDVVGDGATWVWSVVDLARGEAVVEPGAVRDPGATYTTRLAVPSRYRVTLTVRYRGVEDAESVEVSSAVVVPDVVGMTRAEAEAVLAQAGLGSAPTERRSNTVEAGRVVETMPAAGAGSAFGDAVGVVVSAGRNPHVDLLTLARSAAWSAAEPLPWDGSDIDPRGFARDETLTIEDGVSRWVLETHPQWVDGGMIEGRFTLPAPVLAGDRLLADLGFRQRPGGAGNATFRVAAEVDGSRVELASVSDTQADGVLRSLDVDLSRVAGAEVIFLRVDAGATAAQDWAVWIAPRIVN